ncbi:MAG: FliA/WhiG family RNA polymerase sigma factor [Myxococcota bacterium]|nr:FliA/WhiG family RNA polymerase sigma factor [Myxococcota bacterium]
MGLVKLRTETQCEERNQVVADYTPLVHRVAKRLMLRNPFSWDYEELVQIGMIGLLDAVEKFEKEKSISFFVYARIRIQGAILDAMRRSDWVPRSVRERNSILEEAHRILKSRLKRDPTHAELAEQMGFSMQQFQHFYRLCDTRVLLSLNDGEPIRIEDVLATQENDPQESLLEKEKTRVLRELVAKLPPRDQRLIQLYYYENYTLNEIAIRFGISESRVSQVHSLIKKRLAKDWSAVL